MQELPVINRTQELYEGVCKITEKLPALQRQTIGKRLENAILLLLELLITTGSALVGVSSGLVYSISVFLYFSH